RRVKTKDRYLAAIRVSEPLQDLDRGGLARPVRPQEGEDLSGRNRQVDALDGLEVAVGLAEPTDLDGWVGHGGLACHTPSSASNRGVPTGAGDREGALRARPLATPGPAPPPAPEDLPPRRDPRHSQQAP